MYKEQAIQYYKDHKLFEKALAAGISLDNSLSLNYTKGGTSNCHFRMNTYLKYFSFEALIKNNLL